MPPETQARVAVAVGTGAMECQLVWFSLGWRRIANIIMTTATPISSKLATSLILWWCALHETPAAVVMHWNIKLWTYIKLLLLPITKAGMVNRAMS